MYIYNNYMYAYALLCFQSLQDNISIGSLLGMCVLQNTVHFYSVPVLASTLWYLCQAMYIICTCSKNIIS